jgi:hypothetical protein
MKSAGGGGGLTASPSLRYTGCSYSCSSWFSLVTANKGPSLFIVHLLSSQIIFVYGLNHRSPTGGTLTAVGTRRHLTGTVRFQTNVLFREINTGYSGPDFGLVTADPHVRTFYLIYFRCRLQTVYNLNYHQQLWGCRVEGKLHMG